MTLGSCFASCIQGYMTTDRVTMGSEFCIRKKRLLETSDFHRTLNISLIITVNFNSKSNCIVAEKFKT